MAKNQYKKYEKLIVGETRVSADKIEPHKFYRLRSYRRGGGNAEIFDGGGKVMLFTTGVHKDFVYCLKLSSVEPDVFFRWFRAITRDYSVFTENSKSVDIHKLAPIIDTGGRMLYEVYIKNYPKLNKLENPYRSYKIEDIVEVYELSISTPELKKYML